MKRLFGILFVAATISLAVVWIVNQQGELVFVIDGNRIVTSARVAIGLMLLFTGAMILLTRVVFAIVSWPGAIGLWSSRRRARRQSDAISQGLVAAAVGDAFETQRQAKKLEKSTKPSSLGLLLTAEAARLTGDEPAESATHRAMLSYPETELLGLRGLFMSAARLRNSPEAMKLVERAYTLNPRVEWVANHIFNLKVARGEWGDANVVLADAERARLIGPDVARRRRAVLLTSQATELAALDRERALKLALRALDLSPTLVPAAILAARNLIVSGKFWQAEDVIEATWMRAPHPDLATAYLAIKPEETPSEQFARLVRLAHLKRDHFESRILEAERNAKLGNWAEARRILKPLVRGAVTVRACILMAEIEQGESRNAVAARNWLDRAARAPCDSGWRCQTCGLSATAWQSVCSECGGFDTLVWAAPASNIAEGSSAENVAEHPAIGLYTRSSDDPGPERSNF